MSKRVHRIGVPAWHVESAVDGDAARVGLLEPFGELIRESRVARIAARRTVALRERLLVGWVPGRRHYTVGWFLADGPEPFECDQCEGTGSIPCASPSCSDPDHAGECPVCFGSGVDSYPPGERPTVDLWSMPRVRRD